MLVDSCKNFEKFAQTYVIADIATDEIIEPIAKKHMKKANKVEINNNRTENLIITLD